MPITLGCPSCGKRFRARDESAGKKVKCPYCQAAVQVPTAEESAAAAAPTAPLPPPAPAESAVLPPSRPGSSRAAPPPSAPVVATPDDWGALPTGTGSSAPLPPPPAPPPPEPERELFPPSVRPGARAAKERPKPARPKQAESEPSRTPEQIAAKGWKAVRRGLFWVQFALFFLALMGFIGFGKMVADRQGYELPSGEGWVVIEGYVNSNDAGSITLNKTEELNIAMYGIPLILGGLFMVLGRMIAGGGPRSSGSRGLFTLSSMFLLLGFASLLIFIYYDYLELRDERYYTMMGFIFLIGLSELWFFIGLTACGLALKRPKAARAVGAYAFFVTLAVAAGTVGWKIYTDFERPKKPDADIRLYEQGALMLGWLLLIVVYSRAVRNVRVAAKEYLDTVEEGV